MKENIIIGAVSIILAFDMIAMALYIIAPEPIQEPTIIQQEPTGAIIYYKCNIDTVIESDEMYLIKFKN